jgi:hypothetical protein
LVANNTLVHSQSSIRKLQTKTPHHQSKIRNEKIKKEARPIKKRVPLNATTLRKPFLLKTPSNLKNKQKQEAINKTNSLKLLNHRSNSRKVT